MSLLVTALVTAMVGAVAPVAIESSATRASAGARADVLIGAPGKPDADRIVCRKTMVLGAIRPRKVCLTAFDWSAREDAAQRTMDSTLYGQGATKPPIVAKQ
jgi:hypothetical protein